MIIEKIAEGNKLTIALSGRLDTTTAPKLETELKQNISGVEKLVLDLTALEYLSSAGLRVLLSAQKVMNRQGHIDKGMPYDPLRAVEPDITLSAEERNLGGLGIYMVKKSMDEMNNRDNVK